MSKNVNNQNIVIISPVTIKREAFEHDMSSSVECDESGSEMGSIKTEITDELQKKYDDKIIRNITELDFPEEWEREEKPNVENLEDMSSPNYYPGSNNPSTSSGYYGDQGYVPSYYPEDSGEESSSINYQKIHGMPHSYYEPLFRPPSSSYYSHNYPRHNAENNSQYGQQPHTAAAAVTAPITWYQQPVGNQHEMLNMLQFSNSNGREARNRAEKNRRDKLNGSIQELSTMVPHVAESPRRVDKTAVLRFSAHGLRLHYVFGKTINKPPTVKPQVTDSLMRLLDSFLLTITCRGQIVLISPSVEQHLGHCQTDLFGQNILHITHPDDHTMLKKQIIPTDLETLFDIQPEDESGEPRPRTQEEENEIDRRLREDKRNFTVRLARAGPRSEPTTYEIVKIDGCFRRADSAPRGIKSSSFPSGLQLIRRARGRDDSIPLHTISGNDIVLVAMARVIKPPKICDRLLEANHYEYKTRHLIDGRIIQCDQRISLVAGYMTDEVNGLSPFTFMHQDDVRWVIVALRQMYDCNSAYGESCYRLLTRTGKFIYLRTRGYLEIDKESNKVHSFVCVNTLVSEEEGQRRVQEMKNKFSIIINAKIQPSAIDAPAAENPSQLEKAVIYLIQNLQKSEDDDDDTDSRKSNNDGSESDSRHTKTPPLSLIPPKTSSIKSSISKSVDVVNITIAKSMRVQKGKISPKKEDNGGRGLEQNEVTNQTRPSVLQKSGSSQSFNGTRSEDEVAHTSSSSFTIKREMSEDNRVPPLPNSEGYFEMTTFTSVNATSPRLKEAASAPEYSYSQVIHRQSSLKRIRTDRDSSGLSKRRVLEMETERFGSPPTIQELTNPSADLTRVLTNSFEEIDRSLTHIENATTELKGQCTTFRVDPSSQFQLEEIIEEHQEQREMLENIQSEYQAHLHRAAEPESSQEETCHRKNELKPR